MTVSYVTGASSGIGAGVARTFASRGDFVVLADINATAVEATLKDIEAVGGKGIAFALDVSDEAAVAAFVESAVAQVGKPTSVAACAGIAMTSLVPEMSLDSFRRMMDVNVTGVFLLAKYTLPLLEDAGGTGSFTVIASDAGISGAQGYAAYCASKHAVVGLVKVLALDHGPRRVRCNAVCPGYVDTPMFDRLMEEIGGDRDEAGKAVPMSRLATVEDVANVVGFLSSDAASYLNGALIPVDGGTSAGAYAPL